MKKEEIIKEPEQAQQNQGGQYVPPQQYAPQAQPKKSNGIVVVIVVVVIVLFGVLPALAFLFLGNAFNSFINSKSGEDFIEAVVKNFDNGDSVIGTWDCKPYDSGSKSELEADYNTTLNLRQGGTFQYGKYGDLENNSYSGRYDAKRSEKKQTNYRYYTIKFSDVTMVENGEPSETQGLQDLEMGLNLDEEQREAVMMFTNYNMYYCVQR